ncbi:hypothetical protein BCON_0153g00200 [Botryotinia convoluta]|uniref:Uncharacterized protein n=1 Tax=Botryotinia convoluta TaxID=54673 RepID=A0A4Z1I4D3_9HELO|nr:hypothetical protein BCON_0153g00200 [Botryotinia convoluta]
MSNNLHPVDIKPVDIRDVRPGCILWLPPLEPNSQFTCEQHSRLCKSECELNNRAYDHPVLVSNTLPIGNALQVTFITMTSTPMSNDGYSHYSPIGHTFKNNFMSEARSRYWLEGGKTMKKLTYLRLFHTYKKIITQDQPYFGVFGTNRHAKASDHCLDEASMARLRNRLSKLPALPWPHIPEQPDPVRAEGSMSIEDMSASHSESQAVADEDFQRSRSNSNFTHNPEHTQIPVYIHQDVIYYPQPPSQNVSPYQPIVQKHLMATHIPNDISWHIANMREQLMALCDTFRVIDFLNTMQFRG